MPLQFTTQADLETDLASKPGIYAVDKIVGDDTSLQNFIRYDLACIKEVVDADGTQRYITTTQSIIQDTSDNSFGYGNNRQWDKVDRSEATFTDEVQTRVDNFKGSDLPNGQTVLAVEINNVNESGESARVTAYLKDLGSSSNPTIQKEALLYKDSQGNWNREIL